ncbi:MAG: oxygenase MpaB family protein [Candidatus Planktophila sp.]
MASAFRKAVSGDPQGRPQWAHEMSVGSDIGLFGPDSDVWKVHGSLATLIGGVRALLMQAAYPAALAGVSQHSAYDTDPLGRLERTTRWLTITSFGSTEAIAKEARRVNALHSHVKGEYQDSSTHSHKYEASESRHLLWVHCAFTDSFLIAYRELGREEDRSVLNYVGEWAKSPEPLGLLDAPQSDAELHDVLEDFLDNEIGEIEATHKIVHFIIHPPFSRAAMPFYRALCNAAISTLDPRILYVLGLKAKSRGWLAIVKPMLRGLQLIVGNESPSQTIARERIARLTSTS